MFGAKLVRCFSTGSLRCNLVKAPMQVFGIDGRYATALFSAASKQKQLEKVETDLKTVHNLFTTDAKFKDFVLNPTVNRTTKKSIIVEIAQKLGLSQVAGSFFGVLAENGRLVKMDSILKTFAKLMSAHRGEISCEVVTAKPLDEGMQKELNGVLQGFIKAGQKLHIQLKVDPALIGGMVVSIGDKYVDMSIAKKISHFEGVIKQTA